MPLKTVPKESTAQSLSFEWLHWRISSTDSDIITTWYSIINSTTGKYCSVAFIWIVKLRILSIIDSTVSWPVYKCPFDQQLSFERSHVRISSTDSKDRTTLYSIINSTIGKCGSVAFIWMVKLRFLSRDSTVSWPVYKCPFDQVIE